MSTDQLELLNGSLWRLNGEPLNKVEGSKSHITPSQKGDKELYDRGLYIVTLTLYSTRDRLETKTTEQLKAAVDALELELYSRKW